VLVTLISSDPEILPDSLACLAASAALAVSDIPIKEIISEVRVAKVDSEFIINPTRAQLAKATMEFMVGATEKNLMMVEGESEECSEEDLIKALQIAHESIKEQIKAQQQLRDKLGITSKRAYTKPAQNEELHQKVIAFSTEKINAIAKGRTGKHERTDAFKNLKDELIASLGEEVEDNIKKLAKKYFEDLQWELVRNMILDERIRLDGRKLDEVRPLAMEVDVLPSPHGAALFTREKHNLLPPLHSERL